MSRSRNRRSSEGRLSVLRVVFMVLAALILYYCYLVIQEEVNGPAPPESVPVRQRAHNAAAGFIRKKTRPRPRTSIPLIRQDLREIAEYYIGGNRMNSDRTPKRLEVTKKSERPNFVVMLFDDSGYGDLGVNNEGEGHVSHTPYLDDLASKGIRFTDFYVTCSICTPSRASIMTGRYGPRTGVTGHVSPKSKGGLPATELTLASLLKPHG